MSVIFTDPKEELEKIKQRVEDAKAELKHKSPLEIVLFVFVFLIALSLFVIAGLAIFTQKTEYWLVFVIGIVIFVPSFLIIAYSQNKKSKRIAQNPNALKGEGYVVYSVLHAETETPKGITRHFRTAIIMENSSKPLVAITTQRYDELDLVNILYLPNYKYCYVVPAE